MRQENVNDNKNFINGVIGYILGFNHYKFHNAVKGHPMDGTMGLIPLRYGKREPNRDISFIYERPYFHDNGCIDFSQDIHFKSLINLLFECTDSFSFRQQDDVPVLDVSFDGIEISMTHDDLFILIGSMIVFIFYYKSKNPKKV